MFLTIQLTKEEIDEALFLLEMADLENQAYTELLRKLKEARSLADQETL